MTPTDDFFPARSTAVAARTEPYDFIGGPCDGVQMQVEVDADGVPVEVHQHHDMTPPDFAINLVRGFQSKQITSLYERDEVLGDEGFRYVFRHRGETVIDLNDDRAA